MPARSDSRVNPACKNGIEMIAAMRIRRPCNSKAGRVISLSVTLAAADSIMCLQGEL